jgi:hypothetical protein
MLIAALHESAVGGASKDRLTEISFRWNSTTSSVASPAFVLGHDPIKKFVCLSYSGDLAVKHATDFRAVVNSEWYRRICDRAQLAHV